MNSEARSHRPIGIFDSGLGGLTVVKQLLHDLPHEDVIYFGDLARLPYGIKSRKQIIRFSQENIRFLIGKRVKAVIIACHSASSAAYQALKRQMGVPVIDVISPMVAEVVKETRNNRIGIIGTLATVQSKAYEKQILRLKPQAKVFSVGCPLFVPLVETGWQDDKIARAIARRYLKPLLTEKIDVLVLGCTHYPLLRKTIQAVVGKKVRVLESAPPTLERLRAVLEKANMAKTQGKGTLQIFVTDKGQKFQEIGSRFLGRKISSIREVPAIAD